MHLWTKYENSNTQFKVWWIIEIIVKVMSIKILIKEYSQLWSLDSVLNWTYLILQVFKGIGYMVLQLIKVLHAERYICSAPGCSSVGSDRLQIVTGYFSLKPWHPSLGTSAVTASPLLDGSRLPAQIVSAVPYSARWPFCCFSYSLVIAVLHALPDIPSRFHTDRTVNPLQPTSTGNKPNAFSFILLVCH